MATFSAMENWARRRRGGGVVSCLAERYLRTDVGCGSALCTRQCPQQQPNKHLLLSANARCYVLFDATVAARCAAFLEAAHPALGDLYLCESVADAMPSQRAFARVRALATPLHGDKRCVFFANDHSAATFVRRAPGESSARRAARALLAAAAWLSDHLRDAAAAVRFVVLCEDPLVRSVHAEEPLPARFELFSLQAFAAEFAPELAPLAESLSSALADAGESSSAAVAATQQHLGSAAVAAGLHAGTLLRGKLHVSAHNACEAEVRLVPASRMAAGGAEEVLVHGRDAMNRAFHEDEVAVELLPREQWTSRSEAVVVSGDDAAAAQQSSAKAAGCGVPCGRVVAVTKRNTRPYVATFPETDEDSAPTDGGRKKSAVLLVPYDRRIPKICVHTRRADELSNSRVVVEIDEWSVGQAHPDGHIVRVLGEIGRVETEINAVLVEHRVQCPPFTAVLLESLPQSVPDDEIARRRDIREWRVYSIDPPGCRDIDDALSIQRHEDGSLTVGVHIADPSFFVTEGSLLDREARARSTTVYLPHTRFPMIPPALSEGLCSLHEGVVRLAVSAIFEFKAGECVPSKNAWMGRTVVKSIHALSYEQAQAILDGDPVTSARFADATQLREELGLLLDLSKRIKASRIARGALELHSEEVGFEMDHETFMPSALKPHLDLPVNSLVEEFMVLANEQVAERIYEAFPSSALLRRHAAPRQSQFRELLRLADSLHISIDVSSNLALANSLREAKVGAANNQLLRSLATRAMAEAEYFCTGECDSPEEFRHYGLASAKYTHFTSPIRRFADIVVHRLLIKAVEGNASGQRLLKSAEVQEMADHMNARHHASRRAQKDAMKLFQVLFFRDKTDAIASASIFSVKANALLVHVHQYSLKGAVFLWSSEGKSLVPTGEREGEMVPRESIAVDVDKQVVQFRGGRSLRLFDTVTVKIEAETTRSHQPDIRLTLVPGVSADIHRAPGLVLGKNDIVSAVYAQQLKLDVFHEAETSSSSSKRIEEYEQPQQQQTLYDFLQQIASKQIPPVEQKKGKTEDKTVRRWALTAAQKKKMEEDRTPNARPSWEEESAQSQTRVEDRFRSEIGRADKQVKDAAHARFKQQHQKQRGKK